MLRTLRNLERYTVQASDGDIGRVEDFLLDDERWIVRYLVVETGGLLDGRRVVLSPISFREVDWATHSFHVALTQKMVEHSPSVDVDKPVSRQQERDQLRYYRHPRYWGHPGLWGMGSHPSLLANASGSDETGEPTDTASGDVHLRSAREVCGYHIQGTDEAIGHVEDFIVDDQSWQIRYLVVSTSNWWFGKKVLIAPQWATRISWEERAVYVDMTRQGIKSSPEWNPAAGVNREYESRLYDYYGRPLDWADGDSAVDARAQQ